MRLDNWMERCDIDAQAGIAVALTTTGFTPSKGTVIGVSLAPLWKEEVYTLYVRGESAEAVDGLFKITGVSYDRYTARAQTKQDFAGEIAELLDDAHYIAAYNVKNFFNKWLIEEAMGPFLDYPILDITSYFVGAEEGWAPGIHDFDTVYELQDELLREFGSKRKTDLGSSGFVPMCSRYLPDTVTADKEVVTSEANALNLRQLTRRALTYDMG